MKKYGKPALILFCAIALTVIAIFTQSALPRHLSERESLAVGGWLSAFLSPTALGRWILRNLRKVAHFCEYAFLACEVGALAAVTARKKLLRAPAKSFAVELSRALTGGFLVAFFDETIQIFSGRGPMILDVWIDLSGFASGLLVSLLFVCLSLRKAKETENM